MTATKHWRIAAREAMTQGRAWVPTNLPKYLAVYKQANN